MLQDLEQLLAETEPLDPPAPPISYEAAASSITPGRWRHFKGKPYEVLGVARHSETEAPLVVYRPLYGEGGLWVRPAEMWNERVERGGESFVRFEKTEDA